MRRLIPLSIGVLCAGLMATWPHTAEAQAPRSQQMAFGGGTQFEFMIPVQAQGPLYVEATWSSDVTISARLFSPRRPHPISVATGDGRLVLSHTVSSWRAGDEYLLRLTLDQPDPEVTGDLKVVWPSGNRPGNVVAWRNAGSTDATVITNMKTRITALEEVLSAAPTAAYTPTDQREFRRMLAMVGTRLDVLASTPSNYVRDDVPQDPMPVQHPSIAVPQWDDAVTVSFVGMECIDHKPWHGDQITDQPYLVTAIIPGIGGSVVGGRSPVFQFIRAGDRASASVGDREMVRVDTHGEAQIAVALLEREDGNVERSVERFRRAVQLLAIYKAVGQEAVPASDFGWFLSLTADAGEAVIGMPQFLTVTPDGVFDSHGIRTAWTVSDGNGNASVQKLRFTGLGADYRVAVQVATERNGR